MTMDDKLHLAPLTNPQNVLDIATGTGIWAIEFGSCPLPEGNSIITVPSSKTIPLRHRPRHRPKSHPTPLVCCHSFTGRRLIPPSTPPNCLFEIDDAEDWAYTRPFDYIHGRALVSCFRDPPSVIAKIFANLTPGGIFEFQDPIMPLKSIDGNLSGTALDEFQTSCMEAAEKLGRPWTNGRNYGTWMTEAGFVDVVEKSYFWATNGWVRGKKQKLQARLLQENLREGLPAWGLSTLSRGFGWSKDRIDELIERAREDLRDASIHAYVECYVVYGRKPE